MHVSKWLLLSFKRAECSLKNNSVTDYFTLQVISCIYFFGHDWNWWYLSRWAVYSVISPFISKWSIWADLWTVCKHKRHCIDRVMSLLSWLFTTFLIPLNVPTAIAIGQCYSIKMNDSLSVLLNCWILCVWVCRCIFDQFWMQESEHVL